MHSNAAFVLTVLVLCYAVVSGIVKRWYLAPALIFVLFGIVLGPFGFHVIDIGTDAASFTVVAQLALTVILFNQAAALDLAVVFRRRQVTFRLLVIGIPLGLVLGVVTAVLVLPVMPLWEAACLAAVVAPTEVALVDALLEDKRIPERVRHALSTESGFYDGFALAALLAALALASEQTDADAGRWSWFLIRTEVVSVVVGLGIGVVGGLVIARSRKREWMSDIWAQLATLAVALVCFEVGERLHGSGFVAAFAGGLAFAFAAKRVGVAPEMQVSDAAGQLLELMVFAMFGSYAVIAGWRDAGWRVVVFAVLALFVVRMVSVLMALFRSNLPTRNRVFIGWFGPRGIGTLVLGLLIVNRGQIEQEHLITQVAVVTVTMSLVVHSITAWPGIRWLAAEELADPPDGLEAPTESQAQDETPAQSPPPSRDGV